jgi:hypothetical protein
MMSWIFQTAARLRAFFSKPKLDRQLEDEIDAHIQFATEDNIRRGMDADAARRQALLRIGSRDAAMELHRDTRGLPIIDSLLQDVRYGLRQFVRNPTFTVVAILTLGIGIGATTAIFSVVNAVLLKPLPFKDSERLVRVIENVPGTPGAPPPFNAAVRSSVQIRDLIELRSRSLTLTDVDAYGMLVEMRLGRDENVEMRGARVSLGTLSMLGAQPVLGRLFDQRESETMAPVVILSHDTWQRRFGGAADVLGRTRGTPPILLSRCDT